MDDNFDAKDFIERYFASMWNLSQAGVEALGEWETEDITWELPWTEGFSGFQGLEQHEQVLRGMTKFLSHYSITAEELHRTEKPNEVIVIAKGGGPTPEGRTYTNEHVMFISFRDGKIAHVREYANPLATRALRGG